MEKRWSENIKADYLLIQKLSEDLKIDHKLASILVKRGVTSFEKAKSFFRPQIEALHNPFLMTGMGEAVSRITVAIDRKEKILIYGDYDVDGTTAVALVYSFFKEIYSGVEFYIPDRYKEGYGISTIGIDYAADNDFTLIIALDCGIKSVDKVDYANEKGIDFIICDHHLPGDILPAAIAVLDPKREDCNYPYKELSGCGIGFKLIQGFSIEHNLLEANVYKYLDLVAISIASDIVPITGENRILAYFGLKKLNSNPCKGLEALMNISGKKENLSIMDVVFTIGPRINAAGRIDDAKNAVKLLIADCDEIAVDAGLLINLQNTERKSFDASITAQALSMILNSDEMINRKSTVVYNENWHKGVIGIVASRLTEKYYRPTVVLTKSNGHIAGSARSVLGYDLYEALSECADLLDQFGGHKYAAGLTMKEENILAFSEKFEQVVCKNITDELLTQQIIIEEEINLLDITPKFYRILQQFAPFGPQNMTPIFISRNVSSYGNAYAVGDSHLKFSIKQDNSAIYSCIGFGLGAYQEKIINGTLFDVCYTIEENIWKDKKSLQLNIKGIKIQ